MMIDAEAIYAQRLTEAAEFEARKRQVRIEDLERVLLQFIHAYANTDRLDRDHTEVRIFKAWLAGCSALGIVPGQPTTEGGDRG